MYDCPSDEVLQRISQGLTVDNFDSICEHLSSCDRCAERIDHSDASTDTWVTRFRESTDQLSVGLKVGARFGRAGELMAVRPIGQGGMAQVWQAYQPDLDRFLAIKISKDREPSTLGRLAEEAKVIAGVRHPNIVAVHDFFRHGDQPVIAMDFIDGRNLSQRFSISNCTAQTVYQWAEQLCAAVSKLHADGIIHGDLKPSNLLIDWQDKLYVADFGLSASSGSNVPKLFAGTIQYSAPEQATSAATVRSDIYSLGKILNDLSLYAQRIAESSNLSTPDEQQNLRNLSQQLSNHASRCTVQDPIGRISIRDLTSLVHGCEPKQSLNGPPTGSSRWTRVGMPLITGASLLCAIISLFIVWRRPQEITYVPLFIRTYNDAEVEKLTNAFEEAGLTNFRFEEGDFLVPMQDYYEFQRLGLKAINSKDIDYRPLIKRIFDLQFESQIARVQVILDHDHKTKIDSANEALRHPDPVVSGIELLNFVPSDAIRVLDLTAGYELKQFYFDSGVLDLRTAEILAQDSALRECYITGSKIDDDFVRVLSRSNTLNDFCSVNNPVTDKSFDYLCEMPQLGAVGVRGGNSLSDEGLLKLRRLEMLRLIEVTEEVFSKTVLDEFSEAGVEVHTYEGYRPAATRNE